MPMYMPPPPQDETDDQATGRSRVSAVADDQQAYEALLKVANAGDVANMETDPDKEQALWRAFLELQSEAQSKHVSFADLIHTKKISAGATPDAQSQARMLQQNAQMRQESVARQDRCTVAAKAAKRVQGYFPVAMNAVHLVDILKRGNGERLAKSIWFGTIGQPSEEGGAFMMSELLLDRPLASMLGKTGSAEDATRLLNANLEAIKQCFRWAFPRDKTAESTIVSAYSACTGLRGDKSYHDVVFGEVYKRWSGAFGQWQSGIGAMLPLLSNAYLKASRDPVVKYVLSGDAERDERIRKQEAATQQHKESARKAQEDAAAAKKALESAQRFLSRNKDEPKPPKTKKGLPPADDEPVKHAVSGQERRKLRKDKDRLVSEVKAAEKAATEAEAANASDAQSKRAAVAPIQAKIDAIRTKLSEMSSES